MISSCNISMTGSEVPNYLIKDKSLVPDNATNTVITWKLPTRFFAGVTSKHIDEIFKPCLDYLLVNQ